MLTNLTVGSCSVDANGMTTCGVASVSTRADNVESSIVLHISFSLVKPHILHAKILYPTPCVKHRGTNATPRVSALRPMGWRRASDPPAPLFQCQEEDCFKTDKKFECRMKQTGSQYTVTPQSTVHRRRQ